MKLDAGTASALSLGAAESGKDCVSLVVVADPGGASGYRLVLIRDPRSDAGEAATHGSMPGNPALEQAGWALAHAILDDARSRDSLHTLEGHPGVEVYAEVRRPVPDLVIVGAGHIAQPMSSVGAMLGFRVTVLDDRPDFATRERFPEAHHVVRADFSDPFADVPVNASSHVLLVTRGHKYDYECLLRLLRSDPLPAYIGMIGSRRRVRATFVQLQSEGFDTDALKHIHAPVGLDIGAETPEEIAVAVAGELVKFNRGGTGASLRETERIADRFFDEAGS